MFSKHSRIITSALIVSLSSLLFGISLTSFAGLAELLPLSTNKAFGVFQNSVFISQDRIGILWASIAIGALCSTLLADFYKGRVRHLLIALSSLYILAYLITLALVNFWVLLLGRFVVGLAIGTTCVLVPSYLHKIAPTNWQAAISTLHSMGIVTGILAGQIMSYFFGLPSNWRFSYYIMIAIAGVQMLALNKIPDLKYPLETSNLSVSDLFREPRATKSICTAIIFHVAQQFSCVNGILFYSNTILKNSGYDAKLGTIAIGLSSVVSTFAAVFVIEKLGRKTWMIISAGVCALGLLMVMKDSLAIYALPIFIAGSNFGMGPVVSFVTNEIFPEEYKMAGTKIAYTVNWITNSIVSYLFPKLMGIMQTNVFLIFAGAMLLFIGYIVTCVTETKSKIPDWQT